MWQPQATAFFIFVSLTAATLLPIIQWYIRPGSVVYSDEWRAYSQLQHNGYDHRTVTHSCNFIDPTTGAYTQGIESMWSSCKRLMREEKTMHSTLFETYLPEYSGEGGLTILIKIVLIIILLHIAEQYKV